ncbi:MAG: UDP-4-amino-4,6-dideoxy-N-acetyl-beta-L-altrosamine transaminase [Clostridiales Family XIII bacterium]|nr:UDP-4-amino-4,6-dideoxy-N-acetyl-beta-L-altrosamine transaminase [Clostridiales Family XIII bacterium]
MDYIPYGTQVIEEDDIAAVAEVLRSGYLTTGPKVAEFEEAFAASAGAKYAVAVSNGTAALHLAMLAAGVGEGDEALVSPLTFAASSNCALYVGAKPVFVDIDSDTLLTDMESLRSRVTENTRAIVAVNYGGEVCDLDTLAEIAGERGLTLIQDCAHSLGSKYKGKLSGMYSGMQTWSLHPVKTITTGEGGVVTTNDEALAGKLRLLRTHGITRDESLFEDANEGGWYYEMQSLGYNYRMTDIQCALGLSQLKKLERFAARRAEIVARYDREFEGLPLRTQLSPSWSEPVRHLYTIRLDDKSRRREVFDALKAKGIGVNVHYKPVYLMPYYRNLGYAAGLCPNAEDAYERMVTLPLHAGMADEQVEYVAGAVRDLVE